MAEILGLGATHSPLLVGNDARMAGIFERLLQNSRLPPSSTNPANWPAAMQQEWATHQAGEAAPAHRQRAMAHIDGTGSDEPDPPGPSPARCFDLGAAIARALRASPWRVAVMASSSWSHSFLTAKHHYLYPDLVSDRARFEEMRAGQLDRWRALTTAQLEDAGQQELLNWVCVAGAMTELGRRPVWTDLAETYIYGAPKAFAVFEAG